MAHLRVLSEAVRCQGLELPGAWEDHPWGETVLKAKTKVFAFLGRPEQRELRLSLKLPRSGERLLDQDFAEPTGYGLGKSGWVTLTIRASELSEAELLRLIEESYRAVAPKTLVKELDAARVAAAAQGQVPAKPRPARTSGPRSKA